MYCWKKVNIYETFDRRSICDTSLRISQLHLSTGTVNMESNTPKLKFVLKMYYRFNSQDMSCDIFTLPAGKKALYRNRCHNSLHARNK